MKKYKKPSKKEEPKRYKFKKNSEENSYTGEYKKPFKKVENIIFTDKDDTLELEDSKLNEYMAMIIKNGGLFVPVTGRTIGDVINSFKEQGLMVPPYIIGDNGAVIYDCINRRFIQKKTLDHKKVEKIVKKFLKMGGDPRNIRFTDGYNIYASDCKEVRDYYAKQAGKKGREEANSIKHVKDIVEFLKSTDDITKVTLAGTEEQMSEMAKFCFSKLRRMKFWTDKDKTKFPIKERGNYRLDIAGSNMNKGKAIKEFMEYIQSLKYIVQGNGENDVSMFKQAIDDDMEVWIVGNEDSELVQRIKEYAGREKEGLTKVIKLGNILVRNISDKLKRESASYQKPTPREFRQRLEVNTASRTLDLPRKKKVVRTRKSRQRRKIN